MENAIAEALLRFPEEPVKTITCDRGAELANRANIERRFACEVYFADFSYARQKGANENRNGLLREFYSKERNLSRVAKKRRNGIRR